MSINSPRIAAGYTNQLARTYGSQVQIIDVDPGQDYFSIIDGSFTVVSTDPIAEGQLILRRYGTGDAAFVALYVAVDIEGTLTWKKAKTTSLTQRYTIS